MGRGAQVVGSLMFTGPIGDDRCHVEDPRSMGGKVSFSRGLSYGLLCWNPGNSIFPGVYTERKSSLVSVNRIPGKYFPRNGTVTPAPNIYGRPNPLGKYLGEDL